MSNQAIVNPDELRRFAHALQQFNNDLQTSSKSILGASRRLGDTWRDSKYQQFFKEFEQTNHIIDRFLLISKEFLPYLLKEAEIIDEYLHHQ